MPQAAIQAVTDAVRLALNEGLPQDESVLAYLAATHGEATPETIAAVLADRDGADAAVLVGLLLFPGRETLERLEPVLQAAGCTPRDALAVAEAVETQTSHACTVLPGGRRIDLRLEPGEARTMVARLRLEHNPPPELANVLGERFPAGAATRFKVMLRHCRLDWTEPNVRFLAALFDGLAPCDPEKEPHPAPAVGAVLPDGAARGNEDAAEVLGWAIAHLESLRPDADPREALGASYLRLTARLRRSQAFHAALAKSSFEIMMAQGARVSLPHPDAVRRELALLDQASIAVTGRPAWTLARTVEVDLGEFEDGESVITVLGGP